MPDLRYEVKGLLAPSAVLDGGTPTAAARTFFGIPDDATPERIDMLFLDSPNLDLHSEHWNVRVRKKASKPKPELTFKRRFSVHVHSGAAGAEAALAVATGQGLWPDADYGAEVEWGPTRQTLTLSRDKKADEPGELPGLKAARAAAIAEMPGKLAKWVRPGWAEAVLTGAHLFGPVRGDRWTGGRDGVADEIAFEVWHVRAESGNGVELLVEVSFRETGYAAAAAARAQLEVLLADQNGWVNPNEVLKTELVLNRYR